MKYFIFTLALISAFFVSCVQSEEQPVPDGFPDNRVYPGIPAQGKIYEVIKCWSSKNPSDVRYFKSDKGSPAPQCMAFAKAQQPADGCSYWTNNTIAPKYAIGGLTFASWKPDGVSSCSGAVYVNYAWQSDEIQPPACPPEDNPQHDYGWPQNAEHPETCHELKDNTDPDPDPDPDDNSCDEFGDNSFLPPQSGLDVPAGGSVCYTTSTGKQCRYTASDFGDGFNQTGQACTGEEPDYGQPQTPPDQGCATVGGIEFYALCPIDPNEVCNQIVVDGYTHHQCPQGCGSTNGEYFCSYPDENANGIPDKDEDPDNPDNPDPDNPDPDNPDPDNPNSPDLSETNSLIVGLQTKADRSNAELTTISGKISDLASKTNTSNSLLSSVDLNTGKTANNTETTATNTGLIASNTGAISENTGVIAGNTTAILDALEPSDIPSVFNPDSASSFYESRYENGIQGVWDQKSEALKQTGFFQFLEQFKMSFSGGSAPDMQICFNVMVDLGCKSIPFDWTVILPFLKICILLTAAFTCRKIIFGG